MKVGEMGMTLEAGKEMDRRCVMNWLMEVYRNPTVAFNTHSDEQQIEFAHDALVLLKEQEPVEPIAIKQEWIDEFYGAVSCCPKCDCVWIMVGDDMHFCPKCGQAVKLE